MRKLLTTLVTVIALMLPAVAVGYNLPAPDQAVLDETVSYVSQGDAIVHCLTHTEKGAPWPQGAWAYVFLSHPDVYADVVVCDGALAIAHHDATVPLWEQAVGALVLTHEAFHLNLAFKNRGNEALTECRAIKHAADTMRHLGATEALVNQLMPIALAAHYRVGALYPQYNKKDCQVPWYW